MRDWLQIAAIRLARIHFYFVIIFALYTIISDAWHLIPPDVVLQRWTMNSILLIGTAVVWYLARRSTNATMYYRFLIYCLILLDIAMATFNIYTQRGMASRAVLLYALPIAASSLLLSRVAIFTSAALSAATYSLAAVRYFVVNFNEGYKVELYTEVGFYCAIFFVLAAILAAVVHFRGDNSQNTL